MMARHSKPKPLIDLTPFRRRIRLVRSWRLGAAGGCIGATLAAMALTADRLDLIDIKPAEVTLLIAAGIVIGVARALVERYTDAQVARSIDMRSDLRDRLTTVYEVDAAADGFIDAVRADTAPLFGELSPSRLYPFRVHRLHMLFGALTLLSVLLYVLFDTALLRTASDRAEAEQLRQAAVQVREIARPVIADAQQPGAASADKQLAGDLDRFTHDLQRARLTRQEALIRANQLAEQAQRLEGQHAAAFSASLDQARSAGEKLQEMAAKAGMAKTDSAKLADEAANLQAQMASLEQKLAAARAGQSNLSTSEQKALEQKLAALEKQLQSIRLSQQATDALNKLAALPEFQEAENILSELQRQANAEQRSEPSPLTTEQMRQMAAKLEALAKRLNSDAAMKEYARELLEAAKRARLGHSQCSNGILGAFGLNSPGFGLKGQGSTAPGIWMGGIGHLSNTDQSSLLNIKFQDRAVSSQKGEDGPETYSEQVGPAQIGPQIGIPYQKILPKYEKTAESALMKGDIPPQVRTEVRDYFASLHQGQQ